MARGKQTLENWIHEALLDPDKEGACTMLSLVHMVGSAETEIHTARLAGRKLGPSELSQLFQKKADAYAQDLPGVQTFCLLAFYGSTTEPQARHPFTVNGELDYGGGLMTEAPTPQGLVQQGMRHTEAMVQMSMRQILAINDQLVRMVEMMGQRDARHMEENNRLLDALREAMIEREDRRHSHQMEELNYARSSQEREKWIKFVPALVNQLSGREVFPESAADTALLETLAENLTEENAQEIAKHIPPHLLAPLMSRMADIVQKKREKKEEILKISARKNGAAHSPLELED